MHQSQPSPERVRLDKWLWAARFYKTRGLSADAIDAGRIDDEQYELLAITFLRSRTATGNSGRWQALTFSRRAKIILGVGSVSGVRDGSCS